MSRRFEAGGMVDEEVSGLIGSIYDTAIDPALWPEVLGRMAGFAGASGCGLFLEDSLVPANSVVYLSLADPDWTAGYFDRYMMLNPARLALAARVVAGEVVLTADYMTDAEYRRTRFFREFLAPRDVADLAVAILEKTATTFTVLSMVRSTGEGPADEAVREKLQFLTPHVRRATAIGRVMEQRKMEGATLADTLDRLAGAVFLLGPGGTLLHVNESGRLLLQRGDVLRQVGHKLTPVDATARATLRGALAAAETAKDVQPGRDPAIPFATGAATTLVGSVISLMRGARRRASLHHGVVAALFVREIRFATTSAVAALVDLYHLTPRETAVLTCLAETGGIAAIADVLGLTPSTVKSHLKSIFAKTGVSRQADLVKLMAGVANPFN